MPMRCVMQDAQSARGHMFSDHVILVLCAGSYSHEIGLVNFVRPLRASSLLTHRLPDIIFYTDPSFIEAEWTTIANFPRLYVYPVRLLHSILYFSLTLSICNLCHL